MDASDDTPRTSLGKRHHVVAALVAVFALAGVLVASRFIPWQRATQVITQSRLMSNSAAPAEVIYEEDVANGRLLLQGGGYSAYGEGGPVMREPPGAWKDLGLRTSHRCCLFIHGLRAPGRDERLVGVYISHWASGSGFRDVAIGSTVVKPATLSSSSRDLSKRPPGVGVFFLTIKENDVLTLFAGQADPADASHFMIPYRTRGGDGLIDGWLRGDDTVELSVRDGLATGVAAR